MSKFRVLASLLVFTTALAVPVGAVSANGSFFVG